MGYSSPLATNDTIDGHILAPPPKCGEPNFVAGWTNSGNYITASPLASGGSGNINNIAVDNAGYVYVACEQIDLDTLVIGNDTTIDNNLIRNIFIAKFNPVLNCAGTFNANQNCIAEGTPDLIIFQPILTLYPNPATSTITIQYNSPTQNTTASIFDITGRLMGSYQLTGSSTTISIQNLPPSIYQCRIMDGEGNVVTKKMVAMR
jgi:hypothetical protein